MITAPLQDDDVPAFWRSLGLPGLVDIHVHFMPARVLRKVWAYFDAVRLPDGSGWSVRYRLDEQKRLEVLYRLGVLAFPSLVYAHRPGMAAWLNEWAADFAARVPRCLQTATFFPEPGVDAYVAAAIEAGARIFKAHVGVGAYDPRDRLLVPVWRRLAAQGIPVVVHAGSGPEPGPHTGPGPFAEVLAANPDLVAVVAHMGMPEYEAFFELALRYEHVHLDTTVVFTHFAERQIGGAYPPALLPRLAEQPHKVLFGTDFPNIPHTYAHQVEALTRLGFDADWLRTVCYGNAVRLLGLSWPAEAAP